MTFISELSDFSFFIPASLIWGWYIFMPEGLSGIIFFVSRPGRTLQKPQTGQNKKGSVLSEREHIIYTTPREASNTNTTNLE